MDTPYYFRDVDYQYRLQSHPEYGFRVGKSDSLQAIWSVDDAYLEIIWFDSKGKFDRIEGISTTFFFQSEKEDEPESEFEKGMEFMRQRFGLRDETISVNRFWLPELEAGIEDLTDTMKEFLTAPDSFSKEEKNEYPEIIQAWKDENQFVLWWGQDFYVNQEGFIETS